MRIDVLFGVTDDNRFAAHVRPDYVRVQESSRRHHAGERLLKELRSRAIFSISRISSSLRPSNTLAANRVISFGERLLSTVRDTSSPSPIGRSGSSSGRKI